MAWTAKDWNALGRIVFSLVAMVVASYVILSKGYPDAHVKWAFGIMGVIVGYWLR